MASPVLTEMFYRKSRGPVLHAAHFDGFCLVAADYVLGDNPELRHLEFIGAQVFMVTPEEVDLPRSPSPWAKNAAIISLGRSPWFKQFSPHHLQQCEHFQVMFYEEYLDILCVSIQAHRGGYLSPR